MSGMSTMIIERSCQLGLEESKTIPAEERVSMLLSGEARLKTRERGFIVCEKDPSEYCVEPSGNESAMSWDNVGKSNGVGGGANVRGPGGRRT